MDSLEIKKKRCNPVIQYFMFHVGGWGSLSWEGNSSRSWYVSKQNLQKGRWSSQAI